ncbi:MAG: FAD-dependent oxidoreductase [Traorella sp.]
MFDNLFRPIKINHLLLNNRIVAAPMTDGCELSEKMKANAAINVLGCVCIDHYSARWYGQKDPFSHDEIIQTKNKLEWYKQGGSYVSAELMHCGMWNRGEDTYGPNDEINSEGTKVKALTIEQIHEISDSFASTALNCKKIGFDMVMLHFAHGWLIPQFLSPYINLRKDEYGGSFENRVRFPLECVKKVREALGPDYPIDMRVSAEEYTGKGMEFDEILAFIKLCEPYIDMVNISCGTDMDKDGNVHMAASMFDKHCLNIDYAKKVKENTNLKVCVVGSIMTPSEAEMIIKNEYADMVAIARPLLADPYWIKKAKDGKEEDIVPCIRCTNCLHWSTKRYDQQCSVNVRTFKENIVPEKLEKADKSKNILVIGGGPAGMKAALIANQRGHNVTLVEKDSKLGGLLKHTDYDELKIDLKRYKDYLIKQINKSKIQVLLNTLVDSEYLSNNSFDEVIIAIGSKQMIPNIKGIENSISSIFAYEDLNNIHGNVAIIGAGTIGCELALLLAKNNRKVTIYEKTDKIHVQNSAFYDIAIDQCLDKYKDNIKFIKNTNIISLFDNNVQYQYNENTYIESYDSIINATGLKSRNEEVENLCKINGISYHIIGDCVRVGKVKDDTESAYFVASNI